MADKILKVFKGLFGDFQALGTEGSWTSSTQYDVGGAYGFTLFIISCEIVYPSYNLAGGCLCSFCMCKG